MTLYNDSIKHLDDAKMNYIEHFTFSFYLGTSLLVGSIKALIHAFVPALYSTSTSELSDALNDLLHKKDD